jgi:NAD(P)-dependent dehydrogenase (short-subunit alcohol dehydrogenase family)
MDKLLSGKVAIVTGASRGIGRMCALELAQAGAKVAVTARNREQIDAVASEIIANGGEAIAVAMDVQQPQSVQSAVATILDKWGSCAILVNNAGIAASVPFLKGDESLWQSILDVNLMGNVRCIQAVLPAMLHAGWGRIINIASIAGKAGGPYISAYTASKHAVLGLTRSLAQELATKNITVNAICPGYVETDMATLAVNNISQRTKLTADEARQVLEKMNPQQRLFQPEEVAALTVFLALPAAKGINGQAINICGGMLPN